MTGLEYIHNNSIIHRDIKPENLVLDHEGYLRITDFGIARIWSPENSKDTSGTPGYMGKPFKTTPVAPEVMCRQNHGVAVDYFAVGVIGYECMNGKVRKLYCVLLTHPLQRPYVGRNRKEIRDHILGKQVRIKKQEIPHGWSVEAADFIN